MSIKEASIDRVKTEAVPLPYAIRQIQIKNYHGIIDTHISGIPDDARWIFLTGENAFGKTAVLQALVMGLYGERDGKIILTDEDCEIRVEFKNKDQSQFNNLGHPDHKRFTKLVAYGPSRLLIQSQLGKNEEAGKSGATYSLFNDDGILLNIESELSRWYFKDKFRSKYENVRRTLLRLLPDISDMRVDEDTDEIFYVEKENEETGETYEPLPFDKLASGYKSLIAMTGDMMLRLFRHHPDEDSPENLSGIVIIDELDLHFHPRWQRDMPVRLSEVFPKVQFVASTHSVIPFLGAPENSVFLKVTRNRKEGIQLGRIDIDIRNLLPNTILTSPIFDFDDLISHVNDDASRIRTEDVYNEIAFNDKVKEKLRAIASRGTDKIEGQFDTEDEPL
ncbi:AAA family ATPase [Desulfobacterales bacterium HSG2]|nr:AAA family ATPase [Desulfobacterales bacterium HSG2]